jgi:hypothetical protein
LFKRGQPPLNNHLKSKVELNMEFKIRLVPVFEIR